MKSIGVFTKIYRLECTIKRCIKSILNQTYQEFKLYILCNDQTFDYVKKYWENNDRVIIILVEKEKEALEGFSTYMYKIALENDFVCTIDADDWYEYDFFENAMNLAVNNRLDIVATGTYFRTENEKITGSRGVENEIVWTSEKFIEFFPYLFMFFRALWGKLYASNLFYETLHKKVPPSESRGGYAGDTILSLLIAENGKRFGVIGKVSHNYTVSQDSGSYKELPGRYNADFVLHEFLLDFLERMGGVSLEVKSFLFEVYCNGLLDSISLLLKNGDDPVKIQKNLYTLLSHDYTNEMLNEYPDKFFDQKIYRYLFCENVHITKKYPDIFYEIFIIIFPKSKDYILEKEFVFLIKSDLLETFFFDEAVIFNNQMINNIEFYLDYKSDFLTLLRKRATDVVWFNFLNSENAIEIIIEFKNMISNVINQSVLEAKKNIELAVKENSSYSRDLIELYINLSAQEEDEEGYINGLLMKVDYLMNMNMIEEAMDIISEINDCAIDVEFVSEEN